MLWLLGAACLACTGAALYYKGQMSRLRATIRALEADHADCQQVKAETAALRQEYDALMGWCGAGVLVLDSEGTIVRANLTAHRFFGALPQTLIGKPLLQATLSNELNSLFKAAREGGHTERREIRISGANGSSLIITVTPLLGESADRPRFLLLAHDVTELRRLETIRRDFVANVSHELRTPLASIRAMAETLQDGALQDYSVADRFLGTIITEAQRLTRISEDLLILSDAESRTPEKERFILSDLIYEVMPRFQPQADKAGITLCANIPPGLEALGNKDQLEQVVVNLVDNAIKYTPGGGRVDVTAERTPDGVAVHVADTGIGIMSQDLPRIFERFYRVDKARSRQSGGTGLGLSIVKHIVESHGGQVTVESEFNRGSTFTFTLPVA